jgi:GTP-binding protein Era
MEEKTVKTGAVSIIGRPNSGKSTLINALIGEKVSITSDKPQTTRDKILGVLNEPGVQISFYDTPGLHSPKNELGKFMMRSVSSALESEIIIYLIDAEKNLDLQDQNNIQKYISEGKKVIICVNKIDRVAREKVGEILTGISKIDGFSAAVPISALRGKNLDALKDELKKLLTEGEKKFPDELYTDRNMRYMAAEIIREKTLRLLDKEVPFGIGVVINSYEEKRNATSISADILCGKESHKPIILGKGGETIKRIATYAREDIEKIIGSKVFLTVFVKVREDWKDDKAILDELGYL